jgi:Domain of unknown function (DUF4838)
MRRLLANLHSLCRRNDGTRIMYSPSGPAQKSLGRSYPLIPLISGLIIAVFLGSGPIALSKPIDVVSNGHTEYVIVKKSEAPAPEQFAAQELQKYLRLITGVELPIVDGGGRPKAFLIGQAAGPQKELNGKLEDSYAIRVTGGNIILAGVSPRSTLYSVYSFLEKYLGCGWIAPGDEHIPRRLVVSVPDGIAETESPAFTYRAIALFPYTISQIGNKLWVGSLFPYALMQVTKDRIDWAAKNRLNYVHPCTNEAGPPLWEKVESRQQIVPEIVKRGLGLQYGGHSYFAWLPPDKYFKDHPEYYSATVSEVTPVGVSAQGRKPESINFANPEVAKVMADNIADFLNKNPEISIVTVWMNDAPASCSTPECLKMEGPLRLSITHPKNSHPMIISFSNTALKFTNEVARRVRQTHPKVMINHLAYNELVDAPTNVVPEENVLVCLAPIHRAPFKLGSVGGYFRPINDPANEINSAHLGEMRKWLALTRNFYVWDYFSLWWTLGKDRPRWHFPILQTMASDLRFYRDELGLTRVSSEIADWHEENMYVYARLSWNPDLPWQKVLEDYCRRSFGASADVMLKHWLLLEAAKENWFRHRDECMKHLRQALQLAETPEIRRRINRVAELWQESECQKEGDSVGPCKQ